MLADCHGNQDAADSGKSHGAPGASNQEILAGVCFKCGSAEHTSKECRLDTFLLSKFIQWLSVARSLNTTFEISNIIINNIIIEIV